MLPPRMRQTWDEPVPTGWQLLMKQCDRTHKSSAILPSQAYVTRSKEEPMKPAIAGPAAITFVKTVLLSWGRTGDKRSSFGNRTDSRFDPAALPVNLRH